MRDKGYTNIRELLKEVTGIKFIDLIRHVVRLDQTLLVALQDPVAGLYMPGSVEPIFESSLKYHVSSKEASFPVSGADIDKAASVQGSRRVLPPGDFYADTNGDLNRLILRRMAFEQLKPLMSTVPNVPVRGCEIAVGIVVDHLNSISPHTTVAASSRYDLGYLVKPEYKKLLENSTFESFFDDLIREVQHFVGRDIHNQYRVSVKDTTLVIEKGLDFRIIDWEMQQLASREEFDHDLGGIPDEYAQSPIRARKRNW